MYAFVIWENQELYEKNLDSEYQKKEIFDKYIEYDAVVLSAEQFTISSMADITWTINSDFIIIVYFIFSFFIILRNSRRACKSGPAKTYMKGKPDKHEL